jgi:DNA-binding MarR family transcriptional regulator
MLRDLNGVIEQRDRRGVTRPAPAITRRPDDGGTTAAGSLANDPASDIREQAREDLHVFLWFVRVFQGIMRPIIERLDDHAFDQAVPTLAMYALLVHGSMRPSEIAATTGHSSGGVSGLLERLEGAGLVTREFGLVPGDRRGVVVRLTDKGREGMLVVIEMVADPIDDLLNAVAATNALRAQRRAAGVVTA